jgi:histidinol-phosphate aminotransferase
MRAPSPVSRRHFVGGVAAALGTLGIEPGDRLLRRHGLAPLHEPSFADDPEYDGMAKLANNENPYGPPESVMAAMMKAMKYANRYGYPDGDIVETIAEHHGVKPDQVMITAGSGEVLDMAIATFLQNGRKVVGADPTYDIFYGRVNTIRAGAIKVPLLADYRQDTPAMIAATRRNYRDVGFVYVCSPNNPTGRCVPKQEIRQLLDGIPEDVPVLIDEAYFHFVDDPSYATAVPSVLEGRRVIVARTFSKIAALAGMRLGYAIAPKELLQQMRPYGTGSINAIVKWGGVAALKDTASQAWVKKTTLELRRKTTADLATLGYATIPSDANFFMVHLKRPVAPVVEAFKKKGILVGRPFPPLTEHLRVSVGTADEMSRFMVAFKAVMAAEPPRSASQSR